MSTRHRSFNQFKVNFWKRDFGALWLSFERERINEFAQVKPNNKVSISGYVKWISNSIFALIPTIFSNQIYILCVNYANDRPAENAYITISGVAKLDELRPQRLHPRSNYYDGTLLVEVYDWVLEKPNFEVPKTKLNYENFKMELTERIEGLEPQIRDFLAFTAISTPMFYGNVGGLNLTMYDSTKLGLPRLLAKELRRIIPEDIGDLHTIETKYGRFGLRYTYSFFTENADIPLTKQMENLLFHKHHKAMPAHNEISLALFSSKERPLTIEDPVCCAVDVPTVIPENTSFIRGKIGIDPIDAFQFIVSNHIKTPIIKEVDIALSEISKKLEKLASEYDLEPSHLAQYGFLNANYNAKPTSILRSCLAYARAQNIDIIDSDNVSKIFDTYFKWNFEYVYEIWEDLLAKPLSHDEKMASLKVKYRDIIRIIRKYYSTGDLGVSKAIIIREAKTKPQETEQLIQECMNAGIIYEPAPAFYKLTKDQ